MKVNWVIKWEKRFNNTIYFHTSPSVSPIYTFSFAGNIIVYTPSHDTHREKYFNQINYKGKMLSLAGN